MSILRPKNFDNLTKVTVSVSYRAEARLIPSSIMFLLYKAAFFGNCSDFGNNISKQLGIEVFRAHIVNGTLEFKSLGFQVHSLWSTSAFNVDIMWLHFIYHTFFTEVLVEGWIREAQITCSLSSYFWTGIHLWHLREYLTLVFGIWHTGRVIWHTPVLSHKPQQLIIQSSHCIFLQRTRW